MKRKPIRPSQRYRILKRDNYTCQYCGRSAPKVELHIDHKIPVSCGGNNADENLVTACADCNLGKAAQHSFSNIGHKELVCDEPDYLNDAGFYVNLWCAITGDFPSVRGFALLAKLISIYPRFAISEAILMTLENVNVQDKTQVEKAFSDLGYYCDEVMETLAFETE